MLSGAAVIDCSVVQNLSWIFDCCKGTVRFSHIKDCTGNSATECA